MLRILIIGGGISGLNCARHLSTHSDYQITIFEEKAEIGYPQTRPSTIIDQTLIDNFTTPIQLGSTGCRRPWVAKTLAQQLTSKNVTINVRTRVISTNPIQISGAGPKTHTLFDIIVNTTKQNFSSNTPIISSSIDELLLFKGGITTNGKEIGEPTIISLLSDNLIECWYEDTIPEIFGGWLERMEGKFSIKNASIDRSFARGKHLAESVLDLTNQSSQQIA